MYVFSAIIILLLLLLYVYINRVAELRENQRAEFTYVVTMYRNGYRYDKSYVIGAYSSESDARTASLKEEQYRENAYEGEIIRISNVSGYIVRVKSLTKPYAYEGMDMRSASLLY